MEHQRHRTTCVSSYEMCGMAHSGTLFAEISSAGNPRPPEEAHPRAIAFGNGSGLPWPQFGGSFLSKDAISVKIPGLVDRFHGEFFDKVQCAIALLLAIVGHPHEDPSMSVHCMAIRPIPAPEQGGVYGDCAGPWWTVVEPSNRIPSQYCPRNMLMI